MSLASPSRHLPGHDLLAGGRPGRQGGALQDLDTPKKSPSREANFWAGSMGPMSRNRAFGGRRPVGRERYDYYPALERPVADSLREQAAAASSPLATYLERVLALAHNYNSKFLPDPELWPLPIAAAPEQLQELTEHINEQDCLDMPTGLGGATVRFRLDRPLADRINARCDELDVAYAAYFRAVLRPAAGFTAESVRRLHVQEALDLDTRRAQKAS